MDRACSYRVIRFREHRKVLDGVIDEALAAHPEDIPVARLVGSFRAMMDMTEMIMSEVDEVRSRRCPYVD